MEKKDILYLIGAIVIVALLAVVIKPLFTQGTLPLSLPFSHDREEQLPPANSPVITPSPVPTSTPAGEPWSGEVIVLHFLDERPATEINESMIQNATPTPTPTPHVFVGNSTVTAAYPVVPTYKPEIPEGAVHRPTMENRGLINTSTIYDQTYELRYNSVAFLVDVVKPPFVIAYTTTPTTLDPYYLNNPNYCFMIITVRDPETMSVITEEGYGRNYSTDTDKVITLYRSGTFHVTIFGNMVQVKVKVEAGA
jgi:hypothetical protein